MFNNQIRREAHFYWFSAYVEGTSCGFENNNHSWYNNIILVTTLHGGLHVNLIIDLWSIFAQGSTVQFFVISIRGDPIVANIPLQDSDWSVKKKRENRCYQLLSDNKYFLLRLSTKTMFDQKGILRLNRNISTVVFSAVWLPSELMIILRKTTNTTIIYISD